MRAKRAIRLTARQLLKTLQWGLILLCLVFSIVGGVAAERMLEVLHCQPHTDPALRSCSWLTNPVALRLTPFLSVGSIVDYPFVLLTHFWGLLLVGFVVFCLALGVPIVGNQNARTVMESLGCSPGTFDPFSSPCMKAPGFWTPRLTLYFIPLAGPLLAPVWLVMGFWDVLLGWLVLIGATFALKSHLSQLTNPKARPHPSAHPLRRP